MEKKVGIIGVGHVGSTTAYTLIQKQVVDELILYDKNEPLILAEVNDLTQGQIGNESYIKVKGNDLSELGKCDVLVFSAGNIKLLEGDTDRFDELIFTKQVVEEWAPKIKDSGFKGILLSITNPCDVIVRYLQKLTGLPKERVLGTGTSLDTARMKQAVGEALNIHPNSVEGYVLGEHGETQFIAWSTLSVGSQALLTLSHEKKQMIEEEARAAGWRIFQGKVYTCYGIANQAASLVKAILNDGKIVVPVSSYLPSEDIYIGQPALIGKDGVEKNYVLELEAEEKEKWQTSIERIKEMYEAI